MKIKLDLFQQLLSTQNYLEFDRVIISMENSIKENITVEIIGKDDNVATTLKTLEELDFYKKRAIQIYGIYGYF